MIARRSRTPAHRRRRGVVLILVLSMLGLLAVIGVSFATFSGQARDAARIYATKLDRPNADGLIEFAIRQLINDTTNPMSALYGHGLKRDMYGNDAADNAFYGRNPDGSLPLITGPGTLPNPIPNSFPPRWAITTNIPNTGAFSFVGWTLTIPGSATNTPQEVAQTFHVVGNPTAPADPRVSLVITGSHSPAIHQGVIMAPPAAGRAFTLDGRYRHAFNGTGTAALASRVNQAMNGPGAPALNDPGNRNPGQFANFRVSGSLLEGDLNYTTRPFNVNRLPVDEDYDAPDLENWFLAVQSADGSVVIPSFHRPGILAVDANGLTDMNAPHPDDLAPGTPEYRRSVRAISKILRPRPVDHPLAGFSDLSPDPATGRIEYDVDNDGDGVADSVWLDVGYPTQRSEDGRQYKPLVSFMVLGLNGRLPLNTAGNLNARYPVNDPATPGFDEAGMPLFDHASHLGYSPSEINPKYALQNAPDFATDASGLNLRDLAKPENRQFDDAPAPETVLGPPIYHHIPVSLSQLRALLTGTRPNPNFDPGEQNTVRVGGVDVRFSNNVLDARLPAEQAELVGNTLDRSANTPVAGRWGEADGVPPRLRPYLGTINDYTVNPLDYRLDRALNFSASTVNYASLGNTFDIPNPVRPGQSPFPNGRYMTEGLDDNFDTFDFFPNRSARTNAFSAGGPEAGPVADGSGAVIRSDAHDFAQMPLLASERIRRFVTPIDPTGTGLVTRYDQAPVIDPDPTAPFVPFDIGPDKRGRVGFMHYFRPPGVPIDVDDDSIDGNRADLVSTDRLIPNDNSNLDPSYVLARNRHNLYHGYESYRNPAGANSYLMAAMPFNRSAANDGAGFLPRDGSGVPVTPDDLDLFFNNGTVADYIGTYNELTINSAPTGRLIDDPSPFLAPVQTMPPPAPSDAVHTYPIVTPLFNDPNEMNLYWPDGNDAPFQPTDLEWLYRQQDVDGDLLSSRLADLAPISFVHAADATTRRRLFSTESWDRIDYSFANDNPRGLGVPFNASLGAGTVFLSPGSPTEVLPTQQARPQVNARFLGGESASFDVLNVRSGGNLPTPGVAHGGRRINLNHPLPHSYDPFEPVRQKWITETYQTLKLVLPPHAIDTPHELARLGQFVVNIVDFRDPDNAITIWDNPDVQHVPAGRRDIGNNGNQDPEDLDVPPSIHLAYRADGSPDPRYNDPNHVALRHYGMEYQPVAINEALGFQFSYADPGITSGPDRNARANRLFIELINTLTDDDTGDASDLDLEGWDFVLVREDPDDSYVTGDPYFSPVFVRPDPINGQIPLVGPAVTPPILPDTATTVTGDQSVPVLVGTGLRPNLANRTADYDGSGLADSIAPVEPNGDISHHVITGVRLDGDTPTNLNQDIGRGFPNNPDTDFAENWDLVPPIDELDVAGEPGHYYWLYLRRPANPLLPAQPDPTDPNGVGYYNPLVVVDSIRFPFSSSEGTGRTVDIGSGQFREREGIPPRQPIYSIARPQPFRGGQLVPDPEDPTLPLFLYGSSDQARPTQNDTGDNSPRNAYGHYDNSTVVDDDGGSRVPGEPNDDDNVVETTARIFETIGRSNDSNDGGIGPEAWDYLAFHDRDFVSVSELLLVPACPPGLFTKQFVEQPPTLLTATTGWDDTNGDSIVNELAAFFPTPPVVSNFPTNDGYEFVPDDTVDGVSPSIPDAQVRTYPYLAHEFYYSSDPSIILDPQDSFGDGLAEPHLVGGGTSAGWHRMLEFFEVPSPVLDAIGPVSQGANFDWFRQDRRPGQINLNLVIDEEVFFGLLDDPRLLNRTNLATINPSVNIFTSLVEPGSSRPNLSVPSVVTQVNLNGRPVDSFPMANRGFTVFSTDQAGRFLSADPTSLDFPWSTMKKAFADFLKQRHGGSGLLFGFGDGPPGTGNPVGSFVFPIAADRPYRSASHFDIQRTLLRPATMEPADPTIDYNRDGAVPDATTNPVLNLDPVAGVIVADPGLKVSQFDRNDGNATLDPGVVYQPFVDPADATTIRSLYANPARNPASGIKPIVPPIPPRRWFQVPDWTNPAGTPPNQSNAGTGLAQITSYTPITNFNIALSNASPATTPPPNGSPSLFPEWTFFDGANYLEMWDPQSGASAFLGGSLVGTGGPDTLNDGTSTVNVAEPTADNPVNVDRRRHPSYRTELLHKLSNLTTPRTHQYAVWVTVGLFEVVRPGDRAQFIPDELGPELGSATGANIRYRAFFVLDRTRASGFNPLRPGDYRDVIVYRRRIE